MIENWASKPNVSTLSLITPLQPYRLPIDFLFFVFQVGFVGDKRCEETGV
jgi:hypothetical protein